MQLYWFSYNIRLKCTSKITVFLYKPVSFGWPTNEIVDFAQNINFTRCAAISQAFLPGAIQLSRHLLNS